MTMDPLSGYVPRLPDSTKYQNNMINITPPPQDVWCCFAMRMQRYADNHSVAMLPLIQWLHWWVCTCSDLHGPLSDVCLNLCGSSTVLISHLEEELSLLARRSGGDPITARPPPRDRHHRCQIPRKKTGNLSLTVVWQLIILA